MNCCNTPVSGKVPHWLSNLINNEVPDGNYRNNVVVGDRNPISTDNRLKGHFVGSLWLNSKTKEVFICVDIDDNGQVGIWRSITNEHAPIITARDPKDTDNFSRSIRAGTIWINSKTNKTYLCLNSTIENCKWVELNTNNSGNSNPDTDDGNSGDTDNPDQPDNESLINFIHKNTNPTIDNKEKLYSFWINDNTNEIFILIKDNPITWIPITSSGNDNGNITITEIDGGTY